MIKVRFKIYSLEGAIYINTEEVPRGYPITTDNPDFNDRINWHKKLSGFADIDIVDVTAYLKDI